jgi:hypothetical protein
MPKKEANEPAKDSPEQVTLTESLRRMQTFSKRKEKFIAAIKKSKDRDLSAGKRNE